MLDLGNGAFGALQRYVALDEVDAIILSHLHADHCIDMTSYVVALRYGPGRGGPRIPVIGPSGTRTASRRAYDPLARKLGLHELFDFGAPRSGELGPFAVSFAPVNHPVPTYAVRLTAGDRTLVYSGDTGESDALVGLATRRRRAAVRGVVRAGRGVRAEPASDRRAGRRARQAGRGRPADRHPCAAVGVARGRGGRSGQDLRRTDRGGAAGAVHHI